MTNKVCDSILELKIFNLLKKYENVQDAFHAIKTKTVSNFINLEYFRPSASC